LPFAHCPESEDRDKTIVSPGQIRNLNFDTGWYLSVLKEKETEGGRVEGAPRKPRLTRTTRS
jgi:hypothetical protein